MDKSSCSINVALEVVTEDLYDFNRDDPFNSVATRKAGNIFRKFAELGWAQPFFTEASISTEQSLPLACCADSDCSSGELCVANICQAKCPTTNESGGQGLNQAFAVDMKQTNGTFSTSWEMFRIPDQLDVYYEGENIFSTNGLVSGPGQELITFGSSSSSSTVITAVLNAPEDGTEWTLAVACPP